MLETLTDFIIRVSEILDNYVKLKYNKNEEVGSDKFFTYMFLFFICCKFIFFILYNKRIIIIM